MSLNNDPCIISLTLIDLNSIELNYYPFTISIDKCSGSFNVVDDVSTKICVPSETKYENVNKLFSMITIINDKQKHW